MLRMTDTRTTVTTRFHVVTIKTLRECDAEVRLLLDGERREWHATEKAPVARSMVDEEGRGLSPLWWTMITRGAYKCRRWWAMRSINW